MVTDFEADCAIFFKWKTRWLHGRVPIAIDHPCKLLSYKFFPFRFRLEATRSRTYTEPCSPPPPFPSTCSALGKFFGARSRRGWIPKYGFVFPRRYLLFHGGVHRMNEEGKARRVVEPTTSLPSSLSLFVGCSFLLSRFSRIPSDCVLPSKPNDKWLLEIKLCAASALMLRNAWKLGKFDLRATDVSRCV